MKIAFFGHSCFIEGAKYKEKFIDQYNRIWSTAPPATKFLSLLNLTKYCLAYIITLRCVPQKTKMDGSHRPFALKILNLFPSLGTKENKYGKNLKSAYHHSKCQQNL